MPTTSVRGANGLNLFLHPAEPGDPADLIDVSNATLEFERAVMPRRGVLRAGTWPGLLYSSTGGLYTGLAGVVGPILSMVGNPAAYVAQPAAVA